VREILSRYKARLAELGWVEGRNVQFQARAWDGDTANMRLQADELVAMHADVIVALSK
jgi:Fe2+ transport system protein FeoA